tara:strand:- start:3683 stop:4834 length:1152 start_codon:yes stop_codon:yes gene_type:complete
MAHILSVTDSLSERAGGLSHATLNLALSTSKKLPQHQLTVLSQQDSTEVDMSLKFLPNNLSIQKVECFRNPIFPYSPKLYEYICALNPDLIHLRGLWRQSSFVCRYWKLHHPNCKLVVQPAGMLEPWARNRNSLRKGIYYRLFESLLFDCCDAIHATSASEAENLISVGLSPDKMFLIEEGINMPNHLQLSAPKQSHSADKKQLLFLSRIHPKKGIELLLTSLSLLRPHNWTCVIAGMGSRAYENELIKRVKVLGLEKIVSFTGPVYGEQKDAIFQQSHAFILPTYSENFGIAIAEAMSWGLPVITTTGTPWTALKNPALGWYVNPNVNDISYALHGLFQKSQIELIDMGMRCRHFVQSNFSWDTIGIKMAHQYMTMLGMSDF